MENPLRLATKVRGIEEAAPKPWPGKYPTRFVVFDSHGQAVFIAKPTPGGLARARQLWTKVADDTWRLGEIRIAPYIAEIDRSGTVAMQQEWGNRRALSWAFWPWAPLYYPTYGKLRGTDWNNLYPLRATNIHTRRLRVPMPDGSTKRVIFYTDIERFGLDRIAKLREELTRAYARTATTR